GKGNAYAAQAFNEGWMGVDYDIREDLTGQLPEEWTEFNKAFIPKLQDQTPSLLKTTAGMYCGATWTTCKGIQIGDIVVSPDGTGKYRLGRVSGDYVFAQDDVLPHRRPVEWLENFISKDACTNALQKSLSVPPAVISLGSYVDELDRLMRNDPAFGLIATDSSVEDPLAFALEKHLEDFLVSNWALTPLGQTHDILEIDNVQVGQQFQTDTGPLDILAKSKNGDELLVIELKKGRASDAVVGQIQRYMGFVMTELAEPHQSVKGVIIALDDDKRVRSALLAAPNIEFYRYEINFSLQKVDIQSSEKTGT
ncbi:MAG: endonuclease NucS, partial [Candidatus Nanopelagicales bacterium]|nr:endonuclease NucS [Candidatus Nanopelagicales bacterium]